MIEPHFTKGVATIKGLTIVNAKHIHKSQSDTWTPPPLAFWQVNYTKIVWHNNSCYRLGIAGEAVVNRPMKTSSF